MLAFSSDAERKHYAFSDGNGYYIAEYENYKLIDKILYLSNREYKEFAEKTNVTTDIEVDYLKIVKRFSSLPTKNPHSVNPIYVKLIGVENDKKN